ncbi:MAG: hypothetical protein V1881_01705 [Candidatus Micrarchaeota archaeon]
MIAVEMKQLVRLSGSVASFIFGIACLGVAFLVYASIGPYDTAENLALKVFAGMLLPIALGVTALIFGKYLLNEALELKKGENATPHVLRRFGWKGVLGAVLVIALLAVVGAYLQGAPRGEFGGYTGTKDLTLRLVGTDEKPLAGMDVMIEQTSCSPQYEECNQAFKGVTDADGNVVFKSIPADQVSVSVKSNEYSFRSGYGMPQVYAEVTSKTLRLEKTGSSFAELAVFDYNGEPLEGARVFNIEKRGDAGIFTDENGIAAIPIEIAEGDSGYWPETKKLMVAKEGFVAALVTVREANETIVLSPSCAG